VSAEAEASIVLAVDPRYKFGKIYKIFCDIEGEDDIYVGSTVRELEVRLDNHFRMAVFNTSTLHKFYCQMKRLGLDHFHIMLVEEYPCENDRVLRMREQYWIDELKPSLNKRKAFTSLDDTNTQANRYYHSHKVEIQAKADAKNKIDLESGATHCITCDVAFSSKSNLARHKQSATHKAKELADLLASEPASSTTV
jgi:group I intron endonuclease